MYVSSMFKSVCVGVSIERIFILYLSRFYIVLQVVLHVVLHARLLISCYYCVADSESKTSKECFENSRVFTEADEPLF